MAVYRFQTHDSKEPDSPASSLEMSDPEAARLQAIRALVEMARDVLPDGNAHEFTVMVRDARDKPMFEASLTLKARWLDSFQ